MHNHYRDILERINEPPSWFDENGVPRYGAFHPNSVANIYVHEAALLEVSCQACGAPFRVAVTEVFADRRFSLSDEIRLGGVEYGDPPNMGCCDAGAMMSCQPEAVLEYWSKDYEIGFDWVRDTRFEGVFPDRGFDPVDVVPDVLTSLGAGTPRTLVLCTSHRNRIDIVRRLTAAVAARGRVLLVEDDRRRYLSNRLFEGLLPAERFGFVDRAGRDNGRDVTIAQFGQLTAARMDGLTSILVMSAASRRPSDDGAASRAVDRLAAESGGIPRIELALAHSHRLLEAPDAVFDASRMMPRDR